MENLMVRVKDRYYAFQPKSCKEHINTPQARNSLIGATTEKWCKELLSDIAKKNNLFAVNGVICEEIGLSKQSVADLALCASPQIFQNPEDIKLIFEIKMSIVNNYLYNDKGEFEFCGDYTTHRGMPSLLRSDSVLKAIGKSVNLRVGNTGAKNIPIIVIGNSPISGSYVKKADCFKKCGIIQKFISLYPDPTTKDFIRESPEKGFETFDSLKTLEKCISCILNSKTNYFSSMLSNKDLGKIISEANKETTNEKKGQRFIELINQ